METRSDTLPEAVKTLLERLIKPLVFAAKDEYSRLHRVKGLGQTVAGVVDQTPEDAPEKLARLLLKIKDRFAAFDHLSADEKRQLIGQTLAVLQPMLAGPHNAKTPVPSTKPYRAPRPITDPDEPLVQSDKTQTSSPGDEEQPSLSPEKAWPKAKAPGAPGTPLRPLPQEAEIFFCPLSFSYYLTIYNYRFFIIISLELHILTFLHVKLLNYLQIY